MGDAVANALRVAGDEGPDHPPTSGAAQQQFELEARRLWRARSRRRIGGVQAGFPLWKLVWTLGNVGRPHRRLARVHGQMRGATRRFLAWDLGRPYPKAYLTTGFAGMTRAGGGSFDGTATSWSETITADGDSQVTLHGLPAGFVLGQGDYIGFRWTATETAVAGLTWHAPVRVVTGGVPTGRATSRSPANRRFRGRSATATAYLDHPKVRDGAGHRSVEAERRSTAAWAFAAARSPASRTLR
jgi:hypothetical protein